MPSDSENILSLMFAIGRRMRDEGQNGKHSFSSSMLHFQTLRYVQEQGRPFMHDVAGYLCVTPPAATLMIDGLVKDKLLSRSLYAKDRRAVRVTITKHGKTFLAQGIRKKANKLKKIFSVLTPRERAQFITILEKISAK